MGSETQSLARTDGTMQWRVVFQTKVGKNAKKSSLGALLFSRQEHEVRGLETILLLHFR
jgi:hypothetical protein